MKHKRHLYRPVPFSTAVMNADYINHHLRKAFDAFLDVYFPDAPKSLTKRLLPTKVEWETAGFDTDNPIYIIKFLCDIDSDPVNFKCTGTLSLTSEATGGLDVAHYRSIQIEDENQECFDCLFYEDIQTAVRVCELLCDGKEVQAHKIAFAQPDCPAEWAYLVEERMRKERKSSR